MIASCDAQFPGELQVAVLRSAASLIATAAESARLLVETREAQARASFLSDASAALSASFGSQELWRRLAAHTVPRFADGWILAFEPDPAGRQQLVTAAHLEAHRAEAFEAVCGAAPMAAGTIHGAEEVRQGAPSLLNAECCEEEGSRSAEEQAFTAGLAPFSSMVVPVIVRGCPAGVMIFFRSLVRPRYRVADLDLAEELGKRVGVTLENGRLFREARRADRRKEEFLALLGHELRNPLAPILTTLEVMRLH